MRRPPGSINAIRARTSVPSAHRMVQIISYSVGVPTLQLPSPLRIYASSVCSRS